jgi:DNA-binding MarR family transcriptional regulator
VDLEHDVLGCICLNLRRGARKISQAYDHALRGTGLKMTQFTLLATMERMGKTTLMPLAEFMGMDRTTLTRNLAVLERDGLTAVERGEDDRREQWVSLTEAGRKALQETMPKWEAAQRKALSVLGRSEAERLLGDLARLSGGKQKR